MAGSYPLDAVVRAKRQILRTHSLDTSWLTTEMLFPKKVIFVAKGFSGVLVYPY
jgi:hypothetical protein